MRPEAIPDKPARRPACRCRARLCVRIDSCDEPSSPRRLVDAPSFRGRPSNSASPGCSRACAVPRRVRSRASTDWRIVRCPPRTTMPGSVHSPKPGATHHPHRPLEFGPDVAVRGAPGCAGTLAPAACALDVRYARDAVDCRDCHHLGAVPDTGGPSSGRRCDGSSNLCAGGCRGPSGDGRPGNRSGGSSAMGRVGPETVVLAAGLKAESGELRAANLDRTPARWPGLRPATAAASSLGSLVHPSTRLNMYKAVRHARASPMSAAHRMQRSASPPRERRRMHGSRRCATVSRRRSIHPATAPWPGRPHDNC